MMPICHAVDCTQRCDQPHHVFCRPHWNKVPVETQAIIKRHAGAVGDEGFTFKRACVVARLAIAASENNGARVWLDKVAKSYDFQIGRRALDGAAGATGIP